MQNLGTIVVMDAYPLPVEGIEYKVEAAEEANMYMIQLLEALELRRKERHEFVNEQIPSSFESFFFL